MDQEKTRTKRYSFQRRFAQLPWGIDALIIPEEQIPVALGSVAQSAGEVAGSGPLVLQPKKIRATKGRPWGFSVGQCQILSWESCLPGIDMPDEGAASLFWEWQALCQEKLCASGLPIISSLARQLLSRVPGLENAWRPGGGLVGHAALEATKGPRAEVYRWRGTPRQPLREIDLSGAYPHAALGPVPVGGPVRLSRHKMGEGDLFQAKVSIPPGFIGPLACRDSRGNTIFPVDCEIRGSWWGHELDQAEDLGCRIDIFRAWKMRQEPILASLMERLLSLREEHQDFSKPLKNLANRIIGKLWQRPERSIFLVDPPIEDLPGCTLIDEDLNIYERKVSSSRLPWVREQIPGYIVSLVRCELLDQMLRCSNRSLTLIYCHTDGFWVEGRPRQIRPGWRIKKEVRATEFFAPWASAMYLGGAPGYQARGSALERGWSPGIRDGNGRMGPVRPHLKNREPLADGSTAAPKFSSDEQ